MTAAQADAAISVPLTLDADRVFVGALLHITDPARVNDLLDFIWLADLEDPQVRAVARIIRTMVRRGIPADPLTVLGEAQSTGVVTGGHRVQVLGRLLLALHSGVPTPAAAQHYVRAVLELALRRRVVACAERMIQAAAESSIVDLMTLTATEYAAVVQVAERRAAAGDGIDMRPFR